MNKLQFIVFIITTIYLIIQSCFDITTQKVPVVLNNIMLIVNSIFYIISILSLQPLPILELLQTMTVCIVIIFLSKYAHWYGSGDAKAIIVILFTLRFVSNLYPKTDIFMILITLFISNMLFLIFYKIQNKLTSKTDNRHAFFPFLTVGYIVTYLLGSICY